MQREEILQKVKEVISYQLNFDIQKIGNDDELAWDLEADYLDTVELVMALECEFDIEIEDEEAIKFIAVKDIVDYIEEKKK